MNRWIVVTPRKGVERVYRVPARCPRCGSRDVIGDLVDGYVHEHCYDCDHNRCIRLIREEVEA